MKNPRTRTYTSFILGFDEAVGKSLVPSQSRLSLYDLYEACSSHTDESKNKPSHATQSVYTPDAFSATTCPLSGLGVG